jgi:CheY-like chemotaxis protein
MPAWPGAAGGLPALAHPLNAFLTIMASNFRKLERTAPVLRWFAGNHHGDSEDVMGRAATSISVLLVEDEVLISNLIADWLSEGGFAVHEVTNADDALQYIGSGADVDVLFTDINLPGSMSGAELAERARTLRPDLPIVYSSGRFRACDIGPLVPRSIFMPKPYNPEDVCTLLTRLTEAH